MKSKKSSSILRSFVVILAILSLAVGLSSQQKQKLKVYISVDMEGIWGVVHGDQTSPESREYGSARKWMAQDVNAAIEGAIAAGASEIVVNDAHGSQRNINPDDLDPRAYLISGSPKPLSMMQGIDETFQACVLIGYHARAGSTPAVLDHTISGSTVYAIRINGQEMPELGLNAAIAGYFNVPVVMISGDSETCRQAVSILGKELETAPIKEAAWRYAAKMLPREDSLKLIREAVREAVLRREKIKPFRATLPCTFEVEFHQSSQAEMVELIPGVKRPSARLVSFTSSDYLEGFKLMRAIIALGSTAR